VLPLRDIVLKIPVKAMAEINLLHKYPRAKRNVAARNAAQEAQRAVALKFGFEYFDGDRTQGYGGYRDDGRWIPVAETFCEHWSLKSGDRVLDIGCAKGFLVKALLQVCPGIEAFGVDISEYAVSQAPPETRDRILVANATNLPFEDKSFKAAISINTIHNLDEDGCIKALREMERVAPGRGYVQVDSYLTPEQKELFLMWQLTCKTHFTPDGWAKLFEKAGYTGDYYWTITE
jgi:SAM-dependent methyltransferase